jgi:hypothetical protein
MKRIAMQRVQGWDYHGGRLPGVGPLPSSPTTQPWPHPAAQPSAKLPNPLRIAPCRNNLKGNVSFSPGLRGTSYTGSATGERSNPERVASRIASNGPSLAASLCCAFLFGAYPLASYSQLQLLSTNETQEVFGGAPCRVAVTWHNAGGTPLDLSLRTSLYQASSASAIPLGETPWKRLEVLAQQTLLESATINLPAVKAETRFVIQWLAGSNTVVGTTLVLAYPTNLLSDLKPLAGDEPLGVLDPNSALKPLLKFAGVDFSDLEDTELENYQGKLLIAGPFQAKAQMHGALPTQLQTLARKGVAVVWIQPPPDRESRHREPLKPSFYTVPEGKAAVVIVQPALLDHLSEHPQAQLTLIQLSRLALQPNPPRLPTLNP